MPRLRGRGRADSMGYLRNHAIVVTSGNPGALEAAHQRAISIFPCVTEITEAQSNGCQSFLIPPDGSKEGWMASDEGDYRRDEYVEWLCKQEFGDGSNWLDWVEVQYGDDYLESKVLRSSDLRQIEHKRLARARQIGTGPEGGCDETADQGDTSETPAAV